MPSLSRLAALALACIVCIAPASADWQFKSRPDLAPPKLNITIPATKDVEKGYIFVAPFAGYPEGTRHGPLQAAPYIFTDTGDLVWSGYTYFSIWATNFQAARHKGKDVLFSFEGSHNAAYGHGHGHTTFLDQHYEAIRELRAGNHRLTDKHEFHIINEETALIQIYHPVPRDLTAYGGSREQQWIVDARFQELDIETSKVLFEWSSLDHVDPNGHHPHFSSGTAANKSIIEAYLPLNPGQAGSGYNSSDAWDYFHINSVDKDEEGSYLISARDANAIYKINGTTGALIWRLGGKYSNFTLGENVEFSFQHHARYISKSASGDSEVISLYDNSAHGTENGGGHEVHLYPYSRGKIVEVNTHTWEATLVQAFHPPDNLLSKSQGSTQILPNGNALVNWGSSGALTEFKADGTPIFHSYLDSGALGEGVENYRGFRYNWTGLPYERPAIVALNNGKTVTVYVSWNGDTETVRWKFYGGVFERDLGELGVTEKTGFETSYTTSTNLMGFYKAEALDHNGTVLVSTDIIKREVEILENRPSKKTV
jgi:hypothetical protein